jgi:predicted porin
MNVDGTSTIGPVSTPLDLEFTDDVFQNLGAVFTVHFEAKKNNLTLFSEYQYVKLEPSTSIANGPTVDVDLTIQLGEFGTGYKITTWGITDVEPIIGVRWTYQDLKATPQGGPTLVDSGDNWWDVFGGVRLSTHFNDKWTLISRGDIGAGDSDFVWHLVFMADYKFKDWVSAFFGYRWMDYDYDSGSVKDRYAYDALQQGPLAGIAFYW